MLLFGFCLWLLYGFFLLVAAFNRLPDEDPWRLVEGVLLALIVSPVLLLELADFADPGLQIGSQVRSLELPVLVKVQSDVFQLFDRNVLDKREVDFAVFFPFEDVDVFLTN